MSAHVVPTTATCAIFVASGLRLTGVNEMKKLIVIAISAMLTFGNAYAVVKCEPTSGGGTCCWDTVRDGPFKPIGC